MFRLFKNVMNGMKWTTEDVEPRQPTSNPRYPRGLQDVHAAFFWLRRTPTERLPDEILAMILKLAKYDCIMICVESAQQLTARSYGPATQAIPYIETAPLDVLASASDNSDHLSAQDTCTAQSSARIRRAQFTITGRSQGWVNDPNAGNWSWFDLGKRRVDEQVISHTALLAQNPMAVRRWTDHEVVWDSTASSDDVPQAVQDLLMSLGAGHCLSIIPMSRFGGWECHVQKARIELEIEIWR